MRVSVNVVELLINFAVGFFFHSYFSQAYIGLLFSSLQDPGVDQGVFSIAAGWANRDKFK